MAALLVLATAACEGSGGGGDDARGPAAAGERGPEPAALQQGEGVGGADTARKADRPGDRLAVIDVGGHEVKVEIADDEAERKQGLMHRDSLPEDQGMLFVYPEQRILSFWMRNTEIPLDIAYIDRRGYVVDIQPMDPHTDELHRSARPAMYALEMNRGWFEAHGVVEGDRVRF